MRPATSLPRVTITSLVGCLLLAVTGCGSRYHFAQVSGKVTLNGQPLPGVVVTFYPVTTGKEGLPYAMGTTDSAGEYTLRGEGKVGALVGKNRVVINLPPRERTDDRVRQPPPPRIWIPIQYTEAAHTTLIVEVKAGGPQRIDLPLTP